MGVGFGSSTSFATAFFCRLWYRVFFASVTTWMRGSAGKTKKQSLGDWNYLFHESDLFLSNRGKGVLNTSLIKN